MPLFGEQILHIRGQSPDIAQPQIQSVFLDVLVGCHIIKMLGGRDLGGVLSPQAHTVFLGQRNKSVQLGRCQEGIHRVGEQHRIGCFHQLLRGGKILLQRLAPLPGMKHRKGMLRKFPL